MYRPSGFYFWDLETQNAQSETHVNMISTFVLVNKWKKKEKKIKWFIGPKQGTRPRYGHSK